MNLFIIRHGESGNNKLGAELAWDDYIAQRQPDPPLTELGKRQANAVAHHLANAEVTEHYTGHFSGKGYGISRIYCSAMLRALQTAQPIQKALGLDPEVVVMVHEQGGLFTGDPEDRLSCVGYPGLNRSEMQAQFPGYRLPQEVTEDGWWRGSHEPWSGCAERAEKTASWLGQLADQFLQNGDQENVALVVHADFIDQLLKALLGHLPGDHFRYTHNNTAITHVEFGLESWRRLRYVNRTAHYTAQLFQENT